MSTTPTETGPGWLDEPCPEWCTRDHAEGDHPEDRVHQDDGVLIPAIGSELRPSRPVTEAEAFTLLLRRTRRLHESTTWVVIGDAENSRRSIAISLETAHLLRSALRQI